MNAELLLMFTLGCDRAHLYGHPDREITREEAVRYQEALDRRATGIPAQYITGHQEFWGMDFVVSPAVLIPRPETEHVVERVLEVLAPWRGLAGAPEATKPRVIDVGAGSGCIALALAKELPAVEIHATEISADALEIAKANAVRLNMPNRVMFHRTDLLAGIQPAFDLVVSNPPYVGLAEEDQVQLEVRKFEPRTAVFAGESGLEIIERLVPQAFAALKPGGWFVMEMSGTISDQAQKLLRGWRNVQVIPDLQGIARVLSAQTPS
jgi:release factor glutamine methyltransferase